MLKLLSSFTSTNHLTWVTTFTWINSEEIYLTVLWISFKVLTQVKIGNYIVGDGGVVTISTNKVVECCEVTLLKVTNAIK